MRKEKNHHQFFLGFWQKKRILKLKLMQSQLTLLELQDQPRLTNLIKTLSSKQVWSISDRRARRRCQSNKRQKTRWHGEERIEKLFSQADLDYLRQDTEEADELQDWSDDEELY